MKKIIICIFVSIFVSVSIVFADPHTRLGILKQCQALLNDVNAQRWTADFLQDRMEMAQIAIVKNSRCLQGTTYYHIYQSTKTYTLPVDMLLPFRAAYQIGSSTGAYQKLDRWTLDGLDSNAQGGPGIYWQQKSPGLPTIYYIWGDKFGLVPPASATYAGSNKLQFDYVINPSSMSTDTSVPFNGQTKLYGYHELIVWYVCMLCKADERSYAESAMYKNWYEQGLAIMVKEIHAEAINMNLAPPH